MNTNNPFSEWWMDNPFSEWWMDNPFSEWWMDNHIKEIAGDTGAPKEPIVRYRVKEVDMLLELEERRHEEIMERLLSLKQLVK